MKKRCKNDCALSNIIRVPYLVPMLFIIPFLGEKGMEIEGNLKISKFQVLSSASVFF